jgi:hypothetical protein
MAGIRDVTIPIPPNTNTPILYWYCYIPIPEIISRKLDEAIEFIRFPFIRQVDFAEEHAWLGIVIDQEIISI